MFGSVLERSFVDLFSILEITSNLPEIEKPPNPSLVDEKYMVSQKIQKSR